MKPKILSKKLLYKGKLAKIEKVKAKLETAKIVEWERIIRKDFVAIVPLDKKRNIYLSKEWRVAWEKEVLQLPAGECRGKTEKGYLKDAKRELQEEIGFNAKKWEKLVSVPFAAHIKQRVHIFLAQELFPSKKKRDEDEIIRVVKLPFKKALNLFLSGKVLTTSYTILGMLLAKEKLDL